jgi:hypothetical protein
MNRMLIETRVLVIKILYQSNKSGVETVEQFRILFGRDAAPNMSSIRQLIKKSKKLVQLLISKALVRLRRCH